jgi:hypothetical protein
MSINGELRVVSFNDPRLTSGVSRGSCPKGVQEGFPGAELAPADHKAMRRDLRMLRCQVRLLSCIVMWGALPWGLLALLTLDAEAYELATVCVLLGALHTWWGWREG